MYSQPLSHKFLNLTRQSISDTARDWFEQVYSELHHSFDSNQFAAAYSGIRRRLGSVEVTFSLDDEKIPFDRQLMSPHIATLDELGRACLLLMAVERLTREQSFALIRETYERGDNSEKQALLHALQFLPYPSQYLTIAVEGCRNNAKTIFEAIACNNTYPFLYFPDSNFNQMVLKALFIGSSLQSIIGLQKRLNHDLDQMVRDFACERKIAGRPLPKDMGLVNPNLECES